MTPTPAPAADVLRVGDVTLDLARQVVRIGPDEVRLRPKTFDVLTMLVRHAGQVVSKQRMIEAVWGNVAVTDDSLVRAQALAELERAHRLKGPWMELLAVHPAADPLRAEPRFRALLMALRLPELS